MHSPEVKSSELCGPCSRFQCSRLTGTGCSGNTYSIGGYPTGLHCDEELTTFHTEARFRKRPAFVQLVIN
jgi:hypothetical protein